MAYTGMIEITDEDGLGWEAWVVGGKLQVTSELPFTVVSKPLPGHAWSQVDLTDAEKSERN